MANVIRTLQAWAIAHKNRVLLDRGKTLLTPENASESWLLSLASRTAYAWLRWWRGAGPSLLWDQLGNIGPTC